MSRCFPYPQPGYSLNRASNEALIESIKLQRERAKAKAERKKEKRREKKEKNREKKEKEKQNTSETNPDVKAHKGEESWVDFKGEYNKKWSKDEAQQLEKSCLTAEYGRPICSQNASYSSESTQNSNKRRRHASPSNGCHSHVSLLRICIPLQKHTECDPKEMLSAASGKTNLGTQQRCKISPGSSREALGTNIEAHTLPLRPENESPDFFAEDDGASGFTLPDNEMQRMKFLYQDLIGTGVLPVLQNELGADFDDEEWLFGRNHQGTKSDKRFKPSSDISCGSSAMWPSVQYLPVADVYALPFAVPY